MHLLLSVPLMFSLCLALCRPSTLYASKRNNSEKTQEETEASTKRNSSEMSQEEDESPLTAPEDDAPFTHGFSDEELEEVEVINPMDAMQLSVYLYKNGQCPKMSKTLHALPEFECLSENGQCPKPDKIHPAPSLMS
jgi:hypothetical protein